MWELSFPAAVEAIKNKKKQFEQKEFLKAIEDVEIVITFYAGKK